MPGWNTSGDLDYGLTFFFWCHFSFFFLSLLERFISAVDYFHAVYPDRDIEFLMAACYIYGTTLSMLANAFLVTKFSTNSRIRFGYLVFIPCLLVVPIIDPFLISGALSVDVAFALTVVCVFVSGIGCGGNLWCFPFLSPRVPS